MVLAEGAVAVSCAEDAAASIFFETVIGKSCVSVGIKTCFVGRASIVDVVISPPNSTFNTVEDGLVNSVVEVATLGGTITDEEMGFYKHLNHDGKECELVQHRNQKVRHIPRLTND